MKGIFSKTKDQISDVVDMLFDRMSFGLLGNHPKLKNKKIAVFSSKPSYNLAELFVRSLGSQNPTPSEEEALKNLIGTAHNYIEALKEKTKAKITDQVDAYVRQERAKGLRPSEMEIKKKILDELGSAGKHMNTIAAAEATKARNMGKALQISKVAAAQGVSDPNCYFIVVKDNVTCEECKRLHLMPDGITPRVWKLSEIKFSYHKKGEENPSVAGLHARCRCSLTFLAEGFGFKNGQVSYVGPNHDEYKAQRS